MAPTTAEVRGLRAAAERHHQHNAVHLKILQQKKGKPTHAPIKKPQGLEPFSPSLVRQGYSIHAQN
jgi:hypothetical protein